MISYKLSQALGDFMFVENCSKQKTKLFIFCLVIYLFLLWNRFLISIRVKQFELEQRFFKKFNLVISQKIVIFSICSTRNLPKSFANCYRIKKFHTFADFGRRLIEWSCIMVEEKIT